MSLTKKEIATKLSIQLKSKLDELENYAADLKHSLTSESKSTAGDKHDTGRAMIHLEQEKIQHQFHDLNLQLKQLHQVSTSKAGPMIGFGTLILTEKDVFLLGIGLGKQVVDGQMIYCVGTESPIGKLLLGKQQGDSILFNGSIQKIISFS